LSSSDIPDPPLDTNVLSEEDYKILADGLTKHGFYGPDSYYWCLKKDREWTKTSKNGGKLSFPVLFVHARYDVVCATLDTKFPEPMRESCKELTEFVVDSGHWITLEKPRETAAAIAQWLAKFPKLWTRQGIARL
jgi:pimeloyl-ACP methyl ester carboxylesterase